MRVSGSATVAASVAEVWTALQDPGVLARTIPGCERFDEVDSGTYAMTVRAGVASIKGTYVGRVALTDPEPPRAFTLRAQGQGVPGTVDATVRVRLSDNGGGTRVEYDADAIVGGMIGGVGQRMLAGVGRRTADQFFSAVERAITTPAPPERVAAPAPVAAVTPAVGPAGEFAPRAVPRADLAAFATGGLVALAGVALGWTLGRRAARP